MLSTQNRRLARPSLKQVLVSGIGGSVGLLGVVFAVALYIVETLIRPKRLQSFLDLYQFTPFELNLPAEEVLFPPLYGDYQVCGWYVPSPQATTTIVVCPGYRRSRSDVLGTCVHLWQAGHNILVFEYYGHGTVVGKPVTLGYREINDFLGAITYARQRAPHTRLGVVGYSMGASVAIMASARTEQIEAIVADSPFATHRSAVEYGVHRTLHVPFVLFHWMTDLLLWWRAGYRFHQIEPLRDIGRIAPRPILLIHCLRDTVVNPQDATLLYQAAGEPKELWLLPDADHCGAYFVDRVAYIDKLVQFFDLHLKKSRPPISLQSRMNNESGTPNGQAGSIFPEAS